MNNTTNKSFLKQIKELCLFRGGAIVVCLLLAYLPILSHDYAFSDDWAKLLCGMTGEHPWGAFEAQGGRPLYGILLGWSTYFVSGSADAVVFRGVSLVLTMGFVAGFSCFLRWRGIFASHKALELAVPLAVGVSSSIYLYNAWYICFPYSVGLMFMLSSYIVLFDGSGKTSVWRLLASVFLLAAAFGVYQSMAMLFCLFMALDCVINERENSIAWRRLVVSGAVLAVGMVSALFLVKVLPRLLGLETMSRGLLDWNFYGSIVWFLTQYLPFAVRELWFAGIKGLPLAVVGLLCLAGWLKAGKTWVGSLVLLALFVAGGAPVLLTAEKWVAVRSSCVTIAFCVVYLLFFVGTLTGRRIVDAGLALVVCLAMMIGNAAAFDKYFIRTSMKDYSELKAYVAARAGDKTDVCVNYDLTDRNYAASRRAATDEISIRSSAIEWAYPGMLKQIGRDLGKNINWENCGDNGIPVRQIDVAPRKP